MKYVEKAENSNSYYTILHIAYIGMCYIIGNHNVVIVFSVITLQISGKIYVAMTRYVLCIKIYKLCLIIVIKESYHFTIVTAF